MTLTNLLRHTLSCGLCPMGPVSLNSYRSSRRYGIILFTLLHHRLGAPCAFDNGLNSHSQYIQTPARACASSYPGASPAPSLPPSLTLPSFIFQVWTDRRRSEARGRPSLRLGRDLRVARVGAHGKDGGRPPQPIYLLGEPGCCLPAPPPPSVRGTNAPPPPRRRSHTSVCPPSFLPPLPRGVQLVSEGAK